jgi:hypothetical protein
MGFRYCLAFERISTIVDGKLFSRTVVTFEFSLKDSWTYSQGLLSETACLPAIFSRTSGIHRRFKRGQLLNVQSRWFY